MVCPPYVAHSTYQFLAAFALKASSDCNTSVKTQFLSPLYNLRRNSHNIIPC